ncbi:hypothetical protein GALL_499440 [mine drainage metagenome]|uniref:Uncharacterized protein n=1 Tax=mine drainage metagenome TaxID=410659 RepID=A0A1J5PKZ4_9ZZZZ
MAGVHGLQHVDNFLAARFADDDAIRPHPQRVAQTVALRDGTLALDVGGAAFHAADVDLLKLKFSGVFNRQDTFIIGDEGRERVQRGGFTRTRTARNDNVKARGHGGLKIGGHFLGEGAELHQIRDCQLFLLELTNRNQAAVDRNRGHHGVET